MLERLKGIPIRLPAPNERDAISSAAMTDIQTFVGQYGAERKERTNPYERIDFGLGVYIRFTTSGAVGGARVYIGQNELANAFAVDELMDVVTPVVRAGGRLLSRAGVWSIDAVHGPVGVYQSHNAGHHWHCDGMGKILLVSTHPTTDFAVGRLYGRQASRLRAAMRGTVGSDNIPPVHPLIDQAVRQEELEVYNPDPRQVVASDRKRFHRAGVYTPEDTQDLAPIVRTRLRVTGGLSRNIF
jgi:hypothetical protein